jgi:hypothetical protein
MMTTQNLALYRILVKVGATEAEAEEAATIDASALATKADLATLALVMKTDLADLKADLTWRLIIVMGAQIAVFSAIVAALKFVK